MKFLKIISALPLLAGGIFAAETAADGLALPEKIYPQLESVLRAAVQQSPRMLNRALDLEIAENNRIQARAGLLPSLGGFANFNKSRDSRADLPGQLNVTKLAYNFSVNQPVFYWGERRNSAQMGRIQASIAQGQYREGYRALAQTLRSDYLRLIVLKLTVNRAAFYADYTRNQLAKEEVRLAQKVISEYQIFGFRLAAEQAQIGSERAQFDFDMAKASFARLSGQPEMTDDAIPDAVPTVPHQAAAFERRLADFLAQKELPSIEAVTLRKQLESDSLNYSNLKTRLRPKFNLVFGVSQDQQNLTANVAQKFNFTSLYVGVTANWTIFDGLAAQAAVRTGLARHRQMENDYKDLAERLARQAQTQVRQLDFAARSMAILDRALVSSEGNLKTKQDDFARGVSSEDEVNLARLALLDARINAFNGRTDFLHRTGEFLGTVMEDPVVANLPARQ